jgi:hypothetical protein
MLITAGCHRFSDSKLVGTWRWENDDGIEELALNRDHSFRSLGSYKQIFATPSVPMEVGTWQVQGNQLAFDATLTFDKTKRQFKRTLSEVTRDTLVMTNLEDGKTVKYQRFSLPSCSGSPISASHPVNESDLIGSWQIHYNTHDYQFRFMLNARYELLGLVDGKWDSLHAGSWHLAGNQLTWQPDKRPNHDDRAQTWTITLKGTECLSMGDSHSTATAFRPIR